MLYLLYLPTEIFFNLRLKGFNENYEFYENWENCEKSKFAAKWKIIKIVVMFNPGV